MSGETTLDRFLGGRLTIAQPRRGFRAGHDTVLLAAAVPAAAGSQVLELGSGAGVASLCLAARVPDARVLGIEIDPELVALANDNAARNGMGSRVRFEAGDAASVPRHDAPFDHVFFNPPFHPASGQESPVPARDLAMRDSKNTIAQWTRIALAPHQARRHRDGDPARRPGGRHACGGRGQQRRAVPVVPARGRSLQTHHRPARQREPGAPAHMAAGLVLHEATGRNTDAAEAVLRHGAALRLD